MIHVGSVTIPATLLFCQCWLKEFDEFMANNITIDLTGLQQNIDLSNPVFLDMILNLLKVFCTSQNQLNIFVEHLIYFPGKYIRYHLDYSMESAFLRELKSLIISFLNIPDENVEDVKRFLAEVKLVVVQVASLDYLLCSGCKAKYLFLNLFVKIWLIHLEIFLREQLTTGGIILLSVEEHVDTLTWEVSHLFLKEGLRFLRMEIKGLPKESTENVKQILMLMEEVVKPVASLDQFFHAEETTRNMVRNGICSLLVKIVLFKSESFLKDLLIDNESPIVPIQDSIESLHQEMEFLTRFARKLPQSKLEDGKLIFAHIEEVAKGITFLCYSFSSKKITEQKIKQMNLLLSNLLAEIKVIRVELKETYLHARRSNFPQTNGVGYLNSLSKKLRELLNYDAESIASVKHQIAELTGDIDFFRSFLTDIQVQDIEVQELKDLCPRVIDIAYEAEYLIDSILGGTEGEWHDMLWLYHLFEDIRLVKMQATKIYQKKDYDIRSHSVAKTPRHLIQKAITTSLDEVILCLNDQEQVIIDRLTRGFLQRDIVSIVGMAGIGKTTLAKKVYNSPAVLYHFHIRAWCCISQVYRKRELLLDILNQITALNENILGMTDEDLEFKLYQLLKQKRYLIVMDDIWSTGAWDDLGKSFPNDNNGSRILITSRIKDVALKAKSQTDPHTLRLLSDVESWNLLCMKIFHEECCPEELIEFGKQIAKSCKGLPLAIVAMSGLLERIDKQQNCWKEIAESLSSRIVDDPLKQCLDILELSYNHLPEYLKPCFLYFGAFPEDEDIPARKLTRLWVAEGFIDETGFQSLEGLAEEYLLDLIGRSLVLFAQRRSRGGVKTCRIHDMVRHLCLSKAKEENFLRVISRSDEPIASFDGLDYGVGFSYSDPSNSVAHEDHRLCICSKRKHFVISSPSGPCVRSLLFFATSDMYPRCPYDISFISRNFKLLKVLNLECINMGTSFPDGIELLVHLRYLAVSGYIDSVPSSIANLWNLETFIVKGLKGKVELPITIWCMVRLRHVHVSNHAVFSLQNDILGNLDNLVSLSSLLLFCEDNANKMLRRFPNLGKLRCIFCESWTNSQICNQFPSLDVLTQLESLKISYYGRNFHPGEFSFPLNLKKLTLSNFRLPWSHISMIGRLQNLEVLKLLARAFEGESWDMEEGEFSKLKFLKLDTLNIAKWNAMSDHLPNLQQLVLRSCKHLEEVPSSFGEIPTLEMIEVQWCGDSAEESVRRIREEADQRLKIFVNLSDLDFRSSS